MSSLERLQAIASTLPPEAVEALIAVAERMTPVAQLETCLAALPEEEVEPEVAARIDAALNESGADIPHEEMWDRLSRR